ncbi:MAG: hypothetical protein ACI84D_002745 [Thalassolituus oleivorans]|jgi:hypothetical protein
MLSLLRCAIIGGVLLVGCEPSTQAPVSPEAYSRADTLRSLLEMEVDRPEDYRNTLALLDLFGIELMNTPYPDTGLATDQGRRLTSLLHAHSLARAFLAGTDGHPFYHIIRGHVAERMLKANWMTRVRLDSLDAYYLGHAIGGLSPDMDRIIQTLDRLDHRNPAKTRLAREALANLEAYRMVLEDRRDAMKIGPGFRLSGERTSVEEFYDAIPDNVASLQMLAGLPE